MLEETGKVNGNLTLDEDLLLRGMVTGTVLVPRERRLVLRGMVCGDLVVDAGGIAEVYGMVCGSVICRGEVDIWGMIVGGVEASEGRATVHPNAVLNASTR